MNQGMDPEVVRYFRKILNSLSALLLWMMSAVTAGLFFGLAVPNGPPRWYHFLFYALLLASFALLLRYFYRTWKKG